MPGSESISTAEIVQFGQILSLTKTQSEAIKDLHQAYQAEVDQASKVFQDKSDKISQEFQDTQDQSVWSEMPDAVEKLRTKTGELEKSFLGDVKALLTPDQIAKWPTLERTHRRTKSLPGGMLAGESIDLVKMVDELKLPTTPDAVSQSLDRYEQDMDQAIIERDGKREDLQSQLPGFGGKKKDSAGAGGGGGSGGGAGGGGGAFGGFDFQKMRDTWAEMRKTGVKVRDINDRYSAIIASSLPEEQQSDFTTRFKAAKFPQVYRESYALKALNAASGFKDLDKDQQASISDLLGVYKRDAGPAADRVAKAQADAEKDGGGDQFGGWMRMAGGDQGNDDSELTQARKAKRKLDSDALDKLKAVLNAEQADRLPERDSNPFQFGGGRGR